MARKIKPTKSPEYIEACIREVYEERYSICIADLDTDPNLTEFDCREVAEKSAEQERKRLERGKQETLF